MSTREERLELRLQGAAAYIRSTAAASRSSLRQNHQPPQQQQQPQRQSLQRPLRSATKSLTPLPHRNSELLLLQEKRERAREQERKEREKEKERLDREELIPDSKKAPQVRSTPFSPHFFPSTSYTNDEEDGDEIVEVASF